MRSDVFFAFSAQYGSEVEELQQHRTADKEVQQQLRSEVGTRSKEWQITFVLLIICLPVPFLSHLSAKDLKELCTVFLQNHSLTTALRCRVG